MASERVSEYTCHVFIGLTWTNITSGKFLDKDLTKDPKETNLSLKQNFEF
jgi:hypothetical protein